MTDITTTKQYLSDYIEAQKRALDSISTDQLAELIALFEQFHAEGKQIFVCGNGGSASNSSHFVTDLGKGSSDKMGKRFKVLSLNDNISWMTALSNDYAYDQVYAMQLQNYAQAGDVLMLISVSGSSPNLVQAATWAKANGLTVISLVGAKRGALADLSDVLMVIDDTHYGRVEDAQMGICHLICYYFMEN
jgi:D-sedoheptulose 7-phosphate isomerase